jgi:hypothetical protein
VEIATRGFSEGNVIGEGGYGVVYRGVLQDSVVAVKNLHNNKYVFHVYVYYYYTTLLAALVMFHHICVCLFCLWDNYSIM